MLICCCFISFVNIILIISLQLFLNTFKGEAIVTPVLVFIDNGNYTITLKYLLLSFKIFEAEGDCGPTTNFC